MIIEIKLINELNELMFFRGLWLMHSVRFDEIHRQYPTIHVDILIKQEHSLLENGWIPSETKFIVF